MPPARSPATPHVTRSAGPSPAGPSPVVRAAACAAAAALGVMLGLGLAGVGSNGPATALARLSVVALRLRGLPEFVTPDRDGGLAATYGGLQVAALAAAWGGVLGAMWRVLVTRRTPRRVGGAALAGVLAALIGADTLAPTPFRLAAGTLAGPEWRLMIVAVALAAWAGARGTLADAGS